MALRHIRHPGFHAFSTSCGFGAARTAEVWITSGSVLPRTGTSARYAVSNCPFKSSRVASLKMSLNGQFETARSEEHTSELQSPCNLVCRLLLEKKKPTRGGRASTAPTLTR